MPKVHYPGKRYTLKYQVCSMLFLSRCIFLSRTPWLVLFHVHCTNCLKRLKRRFVPFSPKYQLPDICVFPPQQVSEFSIRVSFLELYNEELFDLLSPGEETGNRLRIFEDSARKVCIRASS